MRRLTAARSRPLVALLLLLFAALSGCATSGTSGDLRLGYFANLTHAQPLYGVESGLYQRTMPGVNLTTVTFNAGPAAMEALVSGRVDVVYVGPAPTLNALRQYGDVVRIISGSALGGAAFVIQPGLALDKPSDFAGKRFASPQVGNTQDLALKHWLRQQGQKAEEQGGKVEVINVANADILTLFKSGQIDGAWVPEPWVTRLIREGKGVVHVNEADLWPPKGEYITTQVVTTRAYLTAHPSEVGKLLDAHIAATKVLQHLNAKTNATMNDAIERITGKRLDETTLATALGHMTFTYEAHPDAMQTLSTWSKELGFSAPSADAILAAYDLAPLQAAKPRAGTA